MIYKKDLKGNYFKKEFNLYKCRYCYHNKNNSGGNFSLDFYSKERFNPLTDFGLHGTYNTKGEIINLSIISVRIGEFGFKINKEDCEDLNKLTEFLKKVYTELNKKAILEVIEE